MSFLVKADFSSAIHTEILDAMTRNDDTIVDVAIDTAITEMKGYLTARYDVDAIFNTTGTGRHPVILAFAKDIALYHLHCVHNPNKLPEMRTKRYERAMEWLKSVNALKINPDLPTATIAEPDKKQIQFGSNPKRQNHY